MISKRISGGEWWSMRHKGNTYLLLLLKTSNTQVMVEDCDMSEVLELQSFITLIAPYGPPPQTHRPAERKMKIAKSE